MNFSRFLDIQSWWEVPSIAYFCSLFRTAFNLLDFDIEELEEALLTDGTEECASSLLTELIVRLLNGCLGNNDISAFNFQMYLRRLFRQKCQETGRCNPFNTDIDFQFLPLRTKVEILYALCDFRLYAEDVFDLFKNLEAESLRVEPLGWDDNGSAYWYFYGTRLYREDIVRKPRAKSKKKKKEGKKRGWFYGDDWLDDEDTERVWQVVCFTEDDWNHLTEKFSKATSKVEKELHRSLSQNFLPEIPRLFQEKERLQRKRLLELAPRRTSSRVLQKINQKHDDIKAGPYESTHQYSKESPRVARENRARRRNQLRSKSSSSEASDSTPSKSEDMPQEEPRHSNTKDKRSKSSPHKTSHKSEPRPEPVVKTGRKTNNSLAAATGQIVIPDNDEPVNSTRKKLKTSQIFSQTEEDIQTDMYKVLEQLTAHEDAWPFMDPVEEEYAPNYYAVIRRPMELRKMEERLDSGYYTDFSMFKADFKLIVNNCRLYNGQDNEYTTMVDNLQAAFDRLTEKYIHRLSSSDEEIAVEYQLPTPARKHKLKTSESPVLHKRKKRKSHTDTGDEGKSDSVEKKEEEEQDEKRESGAPKEEVPEIKKSKETHKNKHDKGKKKRKGHRRHGKHSKNRKKNSHKSNHESRRHSKKHGKNKDKEGKKSKKKKNKHHDVEPLEVLKRSESQESLESSNRSRSASPLPSIHTPSPSPTELDKSEETAPPLTGSDFLKDKYDQIKERRRHAAKDAWESLFDFKQKSDLQKQNINVPEKEKNQQLRETIEKLKAKNEKYRGTSLFNSLFKPGGSNAHFRTYKSSSKDDDSDFSDDDDNDDDDEDDTIQSIKEKPIVIKKGKKTTAKNEGASEALEEAVKDISKWLDDAPKPSTASTSNANPVPTIPTEEPDTIRLDDESSQGEKSSLARKDLCRKRPSSREPKVVKRREIQRTIERLQPGKSKGNLLTNISNKNTEKTEDVTSLGTLNKARDSNKREESSPKLSLGSVLPTVEFTLGNDHNFNNETYNTEQRKQTTKEAEPEEIKTVETKVDSKPEEKPVIPTKRDAEVETDPPVTIKPSQEKATPNLSAWFKAFGAPKTTNPLTTTKKKVEGLETEDKTMDHTTSEAKTTSPKNTITTTTKSDSPNDLNSPIPDGGDSPIPSVTATPRQRKTSTGSSISERSSFSQDLDSPRHLMSHTSPLLRSPASPRTDDFQKITYPIINGSVRAGFYHDTTSVRSSPEKSCSPRDAPQSPYSPYSPHVYVSNSNTGSATPNYFVDHNKSPLPTYGQNAPPYYDTSKASLVNKPPKVHEDYTSLGPDSFQQNPFNGSFSPTPSPYPPSQTNYSQPQISPQPGMSTSQPVQILPDPKTSLFPVKKRTYNEPENPIPPKTLPENKDTIRSPTIKNDYTKSSQSTHSLQTLPSTSVDDIALALSEKSENLKLNSLREKNNTLDFSERLDSENRDNTHISFENEDLTLNDKNEVHIDLTKPFNATKKDNIDMVNMGYMNVEDRKNNTESQDVEFVSREIKPNLTPQQKGYEIEAIAINLGINNQQLPKQLNKPPVSNMTPAHTHEKLHNETSSNQNIPHAHQSTLSQYDTGQPISTFSLNDIEVANKKLFAGNNNASSTALDYGNWKMNQVRKPEMLPSDYSANNYSSSNEEKLKMSETLISNTLNYNKNLQHQHFGNYNNVSRSNTQRNHEAQQRNHEVQHRNHEVQQRNHEIQQRSHEVQHRNHEVQQRSHEVQQRNHEVQQRSHEVQQRSHEIQHRNHEVHQRNHEVQHRNHEVQQRNHEVQQRNHEIQQRNHEMQQNLPSELRIPNPRGIHKPDTMNITTSTNDCDTHSKTMDGISKPQKNEKPAQNHTLVSSLPYKTSYSTHSALPIETLRNLPNIPQMLERYTNDERYLSSFANSSNSLYHDKTFQMAQMFNKNITSEAHHPPSTSVSIYSQPSIASMSKDNNTYKNSVSIASTQLDSKKNKRKRTSETKQLTGQTYHTSTSNNDVLTSVKSSMIPASPFNFGTSTNMALSGMYGENGAFTIEDFRNSTNQLMAANYMAAAVAHQQRNNEVNADKLVKPAHQNSNHQSTSSFPFIGHSQVRAGYPFVGAEPSSPLYQQYLQRYQEELQRQTGAQIMGLYPSAYPTPLGVRQPYDSINRPSWL